MLRKTRLIIDLSIVTTSTSYLKIISLNLALNDKSLMRLRYQPQIIIIQSLFENFTMYNNP